MKPRLFPRKQFWVLNASVLAAMVLQSSTSLAKNGDAYEVEGTLEQSYQKADNSWAVITNWFQVAVSSCKSVIRTGGMTDKAVTYFEYLSDGTNSALLIKYNPFGVISNVVVSVNGKLETKRLSKPSTPITEATLILNSGVIPEYGFGVITPVWLANASSCFFQKNPTNWIDPITFMGSGVRENHLKVSAQWKLSGEIPNLPVWMCDFTDGIIYSEEHGLLLKNSAPSPFDGPTTNANYAVVSWTNLGSLQIPLEWEFTQFKPDFNTGKLGPKISTRGHTISLRSGTSRESFEIKAPVYTRVVDRTLEARGVPVPEYTYFSTNGQFLSIEEIRKQPGFAPILAGAQRQARSSKVRVFVLAFIFFIMLFPLAFSIWKKRQGAQQT